MPNKYASCWRPKPEIANICHGIVEVVCNRTSSKEIYFDFAWCIACNHGCEFNLAVILRRKFIFCFRSCRFLMTLLKIELIVDFELVLSIPSYVWLFPSLQVTQVLSHDINISCYSFNVNSFIIKTCSKLFVHNIYHHSWEIKQLLLFIMYFAVISFWHMPRRW